MSWVLAALLSTSPVAQVVEPAEVRQLVTFKFRAGTSLDAMELFRERAIPLYEQTPEMLRFRALREVESPEPLDLIVVSSFRGMAGMDASNRTLRERAQRAKTSIGELYGQIGALTQYHRDEFVEIAPALSWGSLDEARLLVLVSFRVVPGKTQAFETLIREDVVAWERDLGSGIAGADGGRFLLSDGWDYVRIIGISSLGDWHRYLLERRGQDFSPELDELVSHSKQIIVAPVPDLAVR